MNRRSYRRVASLPAYGLYAGERLVATVRAESAEAARDIFRRHGLHGIRVRPVKG
jgi:hypothetical protein